MTYLDPASKQLSKAKAKLLKVGRQARKVAEAVAALEEGAE